MGFSFLVTHMIYFHAPFTAMGTPCELQLFAKHHAQAKRVAEQVISDIKRLEKRYSRYKTDSLLAKINRIACVGGQLSVDAETAGLLNYATTCYQQSDGLFDITSGLLRTLWRAEQQTLPEDHQLTEVLAHIGWDKVQWKNPVLRFLVPGMELDFGGIVKEYAVDRAAELCKKMGVTQGVINLGGDIRVIGPRDDGHAWTIGIRHPRNPEQLLHTIAMHQGALASSGDYERCLLLNGKRYSHVINPKTGWPVNYLASVSVVAELCIVAGSASTIALLKEEQGVAWLNHLGLPCSWVDLQGNAGGSLLSPPH